MPPMSCSSCGSSEIETDDFNGHAQTICTSCGHVFEQGSYYGADTDPTEGAYNYCPPSGPVNVSRIRTHLKAGNIDKSNQELTPNALKWMKFTETKARVLGLSSSMTKQVTQLFENAFKHSQFRKKKKPVLSAACLVLICKQNEWSILINTIAATVQCSVSDVVAMFTLLVKEFKLEVPKLMDMDSLIPSVLNSCGIQGKEVHTKTIGICSLATEMWLACGRHCEPLIIAAAYLVVKSVAHPKLPFAAFFKGLQGKQVVSTTYNTMLLRIKELTIVILELAKQLPWIQQKHLEAKRVHFLLNDVLDNKNMLLSKFRRNGNTLQDEGSSNFFIPPSLKDAKSKTRVDDNLSETCALHDFATSETLCELDIPEAELHRYIRSPEEVAEIEKLKMELESEDEADATTPSVSADEIQKSKSTAKKSSKLADKWCSLPNHHNTRNRCASEKSKEQLRDESLIGEKAAQGGEYPILNGTVASDSTTEEIQGPGSNKKQPDDKYAKKWRRLPKQPQNRKCAAPNLKGKKQFRCSKVAEGDINPIVNGEVGSDSTTTLQSTNENEESTDKQPDKYAKKWRRLPKHPKNRKCAAPKKGTKQLTDGKGMEKTAEADAIPIMNGDVGSNSQTSYQITEESREPTENEVDKYAKKWRRLPKQPKNKKRGTPKKGTKQLTDGKVMEKTAEADANAIMNCEVASDSQTSYQTTEENQEPTEKEVDKYAKKWRRLPKQPHNRKRGAKKGKEHLKGGKVMEKAVEADMNPIMNADVVSDSKTSHQTTEENREPAEKQFDKYAKKWRRLPKQPHNRKRGARSKGTKQLTDGKMMEKTAEADANLMNGEVESNSDSKSSCQSTEESREPTEKEVDKYAKKWRRLPKQPHNRKRRAQTNGKKQLKDENVMSEAAEAEMNTVMNGELLSDNTTSQQTTEEKQEPTEEQVDKYAKKWRRLPKQPKNRKRRNKNKNAPKKREEHLIDGTAMEKVAEKSPTKRSRKRKGTCSNQELLQTETLSPVKKVKQDALKSPLRNVPNGRINAIELGSPVGKSPIVLRKTGQKQLNGHMSPRQSQRKMRLRKLEVEQVCR